jgi:hypothetical protein
VQPERAPLGPGSAVHAGIRLLPGHLPLRRVESIAVRSFLADALAGRRWNVPRKTLGTIVAVIGALIAVLAAAADSLGLGEGGGFGSNQVWGVLGGVLVLVVGLALRRQSG